MTRTRIFQAIVVIGLFVFAAFARANDLQAVHVSEGANNSEVVQITLHDALAEMPTYFTMANPHRLILDFPNVGNAMGRRSETVGMGLVHDFSIVHAANRTRLVLDLNGPSTFKLRKDKNILLVSLHGTQKAHAKTGRTHFASASAGSNFSIRDVSFRRGKNGEGRIEVNLSDPGVGIDIQRKDDTIQVDFLDTTLPLALQRRLDVSEFATPAQTVSTFAHGASTRMIVKPKGAWDYVAYQTGRNFTLEVSPLGGPGQPAAQKKYHGKKLSLDFQNVDVRSVLKVIADFTGMNIVAADSVKGNITIRLKDVPWDQALDIILRAKGLAKRVNGNVIWVEQADILNKKEQAEAEALQKNNQLEPLVTRYYKLNYVRADDAMAIISGKSSTNSSNQGTTAPTCSPSAEALSIQSSAAGAKSSAGSSTSSSGGGKGSQNEGSNRVLSDRGSASFDLTSNTLIVTDIPQRQAQVEQVLKAIDVPAKQVMIDARIVLASDSFGRTLGARLGVQTSGTVSGNTMAIGSTAESSAANAQTGVTATTSPDFNVNLPANISGFTSAASTIGFTLFSAGAESLINLELQAMEMDNRGKIISNPKVITTNLKPAVILQGQQIPYQTVSQNGTQTQFKDAVLCLLVAPQILNNNDVIMNVEVQKDAVGASTGSGPAINVKRVQTQVRVKDGETAVLGGIFEQTQNNDTNKVPLLGDLPVLGSLFRNNVKSDERTEMLIFLTPRILQQ